MDTKKVRHRCTGDVYDVIAERENYYWLCEGKGRPPITFHKANYEIVPRFRRGDVVKVGGDEFVVWAYCGGHEWHLLRYDHGSESLFALEQEMVPSNA